MSYSSQDRVNEKNQEQLTKELFGTEENAQKCTDLISNMLGDYREKSEKISLEDWLTSQYNKRISSGLKNDTDIHEIMTTLNASNQAYDELTQNDKHGIPESKWVARKIEEGALAANITNVASYANDVDRALIKANEQAFKTYTNIDGSINLNKNLHGFVAEAHHVNTFNLNAAETNSPYHARMLEGNGKNSVDIVIEESTSGDIVKRYQSKYGFSSKATESYLNDGDYRGQRKLVPDGQETEIQGATNVIESPDGIRSKPLSYKEAQEIKEQIQIHKEITEYKWDGLDKVRLGKSVVTETGNIVLLHALFQGGRIFGKRMFNAMQGKKQNPLKEDIEAWFKSAGMGGFNIVLQSVVTTAVVIAARNGLISALAHTPAGEIANMVYVGLQNAKVLYKIGSGELSVSEGLVEMQRTTLSAVGGLIGAGKGAMIGASFGPVGAFVGGVIGGIAGSTIGDMISHGLNKIRPRLYKGIKLGFTTTVSRLKKYFTRSHTLQTIGI